MSLSHTRMAKHCAAVQNVGSHIPCGIGLWPAAVPGEEGQESLDGGSGQDGDGARHAYRSVGNTMVWEGTGCAKSMRKALPAREESGVPYTAIAGDRVW